MCEKLYWQNLYEYFLIESNIFDIVLSMDWYSLILFRLIEFTVM